MTLKEILNDVLPLLERFAPSLGAAIGGLSGAATGHAVSILAHAFNSNPDDLRGLREKIVNDPKAQRKLEDIENEHGNLIYVLMNKR